MPFPQIANYTQAILQNGPGVFKTVRAESFEPSSVKPIRMFTYGAGMFAVVFKIKMNGRDQAVRCFLSAGDDIAPRYKALRLYLKDKDLDWAVNFNYLEEEMFIDGKYYPIVLMDWVDGIPINNYVKFHQHNAAKLTDLQNKLISLSRSLTSNRIGHGDLQGGNIFISKTNSQIKLLDLDGMYVPTLAGSLANELGRPDYQHPRRAKNNYNEKIDWFSIWVMITALEAVKTDPKLWERNFAGGFNTTENFLFIGEDFKKPEQSNLFKILLDKNIEQLNFYTKQLLSFCRMPISGVTEPLLYKLPVPPAPPVPPVPPGEKFSIKSNPPANVLTPALQKIGTTPCELDKSKFAGKNIILSYGGKTKVIQLMPEKNSYTFDFI